MMPVACLARRVLPLTRAHRSFCAPHRQAPELPLDRMADWSKHVRASETTARSPDIRRCLPGSRSSIEK